jgi:hypothetical protein
MSLVLANLIKQVELSSIEEAAGGDEWWAGLSKPQRKAYIVKHPKSKYAKKMSAPYAGESKGKSSGTKSESKPSSDVKVRGPKALQTKKPVPSTPASKKAKEKVEEVKKPKAKEKEVPKKPVKKETPKVSKPVKKSKSAPSRGRPSSMSPKEMLKHAQARLKSLNDRITLLNAEKSYRNVARGFTKRDSTKERINERIAKINEMLKATQAKIKAKTKRIQQLQSGK